jgi:hypothetical protein
MRWNKYFGPAREKSPTLFSLMIFADVLGLSLALIEDGDKVRYMRPRWERRAKHTVRDAAAKVSSKAIARALPYAMHQLASSGGKARWAGLSKKAKKAFIAKLNAARAAKRERLAGMKEAA